VARRNRTALRDLQALSGTLTATGVPVLGVVFNRA
jgi:Mrp family chromosome partitioning ATPase